MSILVGSSVRIQGGSEGDRRRGEFFAIDRSIIKDQCHEIFYFMFCMNCHYLISQFHENQNLNIHGDIPILDL